MMEKILACYSFHLNIGNNMSTYAYILFFSAIVPFIFSFHPKIQFYKKWPAFLLSTLIISSIFIFWDFKYTQMGVWGFNHAHIGKFMLYNLPIEECLFFIVIPYCCIFTYEVLNKYLKKVYTLSRYSPLIIASVLFIASILYIEQAYTFSILIGNGILFLMLYVFKISFEHMLNSYIILLVPFFIVNGLLTGSFINEEVVWYNNAETCSIRMGTIPIEDSFYFLLLFFSQIIIYEYFKSVFNK